MNTMCFDEKLSNQKIDELFKSLKKINSKLWVIEDEKRLCEKILILVKNL